MRRLFSQGLPALPLPCGNIDQAWETSVRHLSILGWDQGSALGGSPLHISSVEAPTELCDEGLLGGGARHGTQGVPVHVGAGRAQPARGLTALPFALALGLPISCLAWREVGGEQHQPHLRGDEKPLYALQGTPGGSEGRWCPDSGGHADPKVDGRLECGARSVNSPTLHGESQRRADYSAVWF